MGLLRTLLLDGQMRTTATPRLVTWVYQGCMVGIGLLTCWWLLMAWMVTTWGGWLWGVLLLILAPLVGLVLLLCVRVACEMVMVRFRGMPGPGETYDGRTSAGAEGDGESAAGSGAAVATRTGDAARSEVPLPQGGVPVTSDGNADTDPPDDRPDDPAEDGIGQVPDEVPDGVRPWWFAALAGGVVVVALVGLTLLVATNGEDGAEPQAAASPSRGPATSSAAPSAAPMVPPATAAPSPSAPASTVPAGPVKRWSGVLKLDGPRARRDLDAVPPRTSTRDGEPDIRGDWLKTLVEAESGALVALVKPESRPGALECRDAAAGTGSDETDPVDTGDVVCVLTARGTVARLVITDASQTSTSPTITADVVVWSVPGAGQ